MWRPWLAPDVFTPVPLQTDTLVLRTERRTLCDCTATNSLGWTPSSAASPPFTLKRQPPVTHANSHPLIHDIGTLFSCLLHCDCSGGRLCSGFTCLSRGEWRVWHLVWIVPQLEREVRDRDHSCIFFPPQLKITFLFFCTFNYWTPHCTKECISRVTHWMYDIRFMFTMRIHIEL